MVVVRGFRGGWERRNSLGYGVRIAQRPPVEVVRDTLPARGVVKGAARARDGEEGHEARPVEVAGRVRD